MTVSQPRSHIFWTTLPSISTGSKHRCTALPRISSRKKWTRLEHITSQNKVILTHTTVRTSNLSSLTGHFPFILLTKCIRSFQNDEHIPLWPFTDFIFNIGEEILIEFVIRRPYIESCWANVPVTVSLWVKSKQNEPLLTKWHINPRFWYTIKHDLKTFNFEVCYYIVNIKPNTSKIIHSSVSDKIKYNYS